MYTQEDYLYGWLIYLLGAAVLIPEIPYDLAYVADTIRQRDELVVILADTPENVWNAVASRGSSALDTAGVAALR